MKTNSETTPMRNYVTVNNRTEWEPGVVLEGVWIGYEESLNEEGKPISFGRISNNEGFHRFSLSSALTQLKQFPAGTPLQITCIGTRNLSAGRTFKEFRIAVDSDFLESVSRSVMQKETHSPLMIEESDPFSE